MTFDELQLIEPLLRAVRAEGYTEPSPIQAQAIPHVLAGRDLLGCAQTGTGKTAAFALPMLQRFTLNPLPASNAARPIRALVLSPTRELALQIAENFKSYGQFTNIRPLVIFGGVGQAPQVERLRRGADVLVATPGRLLDLMNQGYVRLDRLEVLVLDEADRMLDMGFIHDVRRVIAALPAKRQTLFFSATMPEDIQKLADAILHDPVRVAVTPVASTVEVIDQSIYFVEKPDKIGLLTTMLRAPEMRRVLVFTRTKHGADKIVKQLATSALTAEAIHGNKGQSARERALANFKSGRTRILVATDIAARGIDVDEITHVINYDLPNEPESYVHRIGRTARAGASGIAYSFCDVEEREYLVDIERLIQLHIPRAAGYPYASRLNAPPITDLAPRKRGGGSGNGNHSSNRNNRSGAPRSSNRPHGQGQRQAEGASSASAPSAERARRERAGR